MATVSFTSEASEILGRLAGSVFQDSNMGFQVRGLTSPRNPQTQLQQLRRGDFRYLSAGWRFLSPTDQTTWITAAGTKPAALRLYIGNNINLTLIGIPIVSTYSVSPAPDAMPLAILVITNTVFNVIATGSPSVVPTDQRMILYATAQRQPAQIFNNPAAYQPIAYYNAGDDFTSAVDIAAAYNAHYGVLTENLRICIKTVLVDITNGNRGAESISCSIIIAIMTLQQAFDASITAGEQPQIVYVNDDGHAFIKFQSNTSDDDVTCYLKIDVSGTQIAAFTTSTGTSAGIRADSDGLVTLDSSNGFYLCTNILEFIDNADAIAGGLGIGNIYRTGDDLKIVH